MVSSTAAYTTLPLPRSLDDVDLVVRFDQLQRALEAVYEAIYNDVGAEELATLIAKLKITEDLDIDPMMLTTMLATHAAFVHGREKIDRILVKKGNTIDAAIRGAMRDIYFSVFQVTGPSESSVWVVDMLRGEFNLVLEPTLCQEGVPGSMFCCSMIPFPEGFGVIVGIPMAIDSGEWLDIVEELDAKFGEDFDVHELGDDRMKQLADMIVAHGVQTMALLDQEWDEEEDEEDLDDRQK